MRIRDTGHAIPDSLFAAIVVVSTNFDVCETGVKTRVGVSALVAVSSIVRHFGEPNIVWPWGRAAALSTPTHLARGAVALAVSIVTRFAGLTIRWSLTGTDKGRRDSPAFRGCSTRWLYSVGQTQPQSHGMAIRVLGPIITPTASPPAQPPRSAERQAATCDRDERELGAERVGSAPRRRQPGRDGAIGYRDEVPRPGQGRRRRGPRSAGMEAGRLTGCKPSAGPRRPAPPIRPRRGLRPLPRRSYRPATRSNGATLAFPP
jgi:hypothetical protein